MPPKRRPSGLRPFEFRLTREQKGRLRQLSTDAGVSMSEYVRRSINSYALNICIRDKIESLGKQCLEAESRG